MTEWLLRIIGDGEQAAGQIDRVQWLWARPQWLILGLILLIPAGWFVVRRHQRSLAHIAKAPRRALSICRIGVLLLLVIVLGGPYVRLDETIRRKPVLGWIVDESSSMQLPAGPFEGPKASKLTRTELLDQSLSKHAEMIDSLRDRFDVKKYRVARRVRTIDDDQTIEPLNESQASDTALGEALLKVIDDAAGRPIAGIVMFTDGQNTTGPDPADVLRRTGVGDVTEASAARVWTVPIGSDELPADLALVDVLAPAQVTQGDTVSILATVQSTRLNGTSVHVKLMQGAKTLDSATVTLHDGERIQTPLSYEASEVGEQLLKVVAEPAPNESITDNNSRTVRLSVGGDREKVLYLEGYPRWDFRFLDHALRRDRGVDATFVMESQLVASGVPASELARAAKLPTDAKGWAAYHLVILGDVSPKLLTTVAQASLKQAVEDEGVGLIVQAGPQHMPHAFAEKPLSELLPLTVTKQAGIEAPAFSPFHMTVTATGALQPAFAVYPNASRNRQVWSQMPEFYWAAATESGMKPGATLMAEFSSPSGSKPLIAEHFAGRGRVMFIGTDGTFRWRRNIGDYMFYRFWGQAIRHAGRTAKRGSEESWIEASPHEVEVGGEVSIELFAVDGAGQPSSDDRQTVQVTGADGQSLGTVQVNAVRQAGHYRGIWRAEQTGEVTLRFDDVRGKTAEARVAVRDSGRERMNPTVDRDTLGTLADTSGGGLIELDQLDRLPDMLEGEAVTLHRPREAEVWDNWIVLMLLVGLYCTDVGIRRVLGLT
ncbi:VWA domain-containing protein [Planctomycetales bacterium ZRK34]|nr:VWA domain-containing protein [Planctomycetales bacterium ZRK34]